MTPNGFPFIERPDPEEERLRFMGRAHVIAERMMGEQSQFEAFLLDNHGGMTISAFNGSPRTRRVAILAEWRNYERFKPGTPNQCIGYGFGRCGGEATIGPYCAICSERARKRAARLGIDITPRQEEEAVDDARAPNADRMWRMWRIACWTILLFDVGLVLTACATFQTVRPSTGFLIVSLVFLAWSMYRTRTGKEQAVREIEEPPTRLTIRDGIEADRVTLRTVLLYAACGAAGFVGAAWLISLAPRLFPLLRLETMALLISLVAFGWFWYRGSR